MSRHIAICFTLAWLLVAASLTATTSASAETNCSIPSSLSLPVTGSNDGATATSTVRIPAGTTLAIDQISRKSIVESGNWVWTLTFYTAEDLDNRVSRYWKTSHGYYWQENEHTQTDAVRWGHAFPDDQVFIVELQLYRSISIRPEEGASMELQFSVVDEDNNQLDCTDSDDEPNDGEIATFEPPTKGALVELTRSFFPADRPGSQGILSSLLKKIERSAFGAFRNQLDALCCTPSKKNKTITEEQRDNLKETSRDVEFPLPAWAVDQCKGENPNFEIDRDYVTLENWREVAEGGYNYEEFQIPAWRGCGVTRINAYISAPEVCIGLLFNLCLEGNMRGPLLSEAQGIGPIFFNASENLNTADRFPYVATGGSKTSIVLDHDRGVGSILIEGTSNNIDGFNKPFGVVVDQLTSEPSGQLPTEPGNFLRIYYEPERDGAGVPVGVKRIWLDGRFTANAPGIASSGGDNGPPSILLTATVETRAGGGLHLNASHSPFPSWEFFRDVYSTCDGCIPSWATYQLATWTERGSLYDPRAQTTFWDTGKP